MTVNDIRKQDIFHDIIEYDWDIIGMYTMINEYHWILLGYYWEYPNSSLDGLFQGKSDNLLNGWLL